MRDWTRSLWPASFKGAPFWTEHDEESGGRRLVVHEFPHRDLPFVEDLGEAARQFSVTAYLVGDASDANASALVSTLAAGGAGVLVLPMHGPLSAHVASFRRDRERERAGYVAFSIDFVREGSAAGLVSANFLAQLVFDAVDQVAAEAGSALAATMSVQRAAKHVAASASDEAGDAVAMIEMLRAEIPQDATASARSAKAVADVYASLPAAVTRAAGVLPAFGTAIVEAARSVSSAGAPEHVALAVPPILEAVSDPPVIGMGTASSRSIAANAGAIRQVTRLALLAAWADSLARRQFADRRAGIAARAFAAERFGAELERAHGAENAALYRAIANLRGRIADFLSRTIADLAPVVQIEAAQSMPSLWWAHRLYGDPERGADIVKRNRLAHPSFVPERFEAVAR